MTNSITPVWDFNQIRHCVPATGYIREYVEYACLCTDAPPLYHILSSVAVVSAAVAPNIDLVFQNEVHGLHLFVLIVGDSSESRKTSAMKRAIRVADPVFARVSHMGQRIWWPTVSSPEGVIEELLQEPNRLMCLSEWTDMHRLAGSAKYWQHASEFWNLIYDATDMSRARSKTKGTITRPRVTILAASTPSLIDNATQPVDWDGGKMARYLVGCATRPTDKFMEASVDLPHIVEQLRGRLSELVMSRPPTYGNGPVTLTAAAWDRMRAWQADRWWRDLKDRAPRHLKPSFARAAEHLFRLAAVYACSVAYPFQVEIDVDVMDAAINLTEWCYSSTVATLAMLGTRDANPITKVERALAGAGPAGMTRAVLLRVTQLTQRQLNEAIGALVEREELVTRTDWIDGIARTVYVYQAR